MAGAIKQDSKQVASRIFIAVFLGYIFANSFGLLLVFALPLDRLTGVSLGTLMTFFVWGLSIMWVFSVERSRTAMLGLLIAICVTSVSAWGFYFIGVSA